MPQATLRTKSGEFERTVIEKVQEIIKLSIEVTVANKAYVFADYSGHTHEIEIEATTIKQTFQHGKVSLIDLKTIYLSPLEHYFDYEKEDFTEESKAKIITELDKVINKLKTL